MALRSISLTLLATAALATPMVSQDTTATRDQLDYVPDSYIVTLRPDATPAVFDAHLSWVSMVLAKRSEESAQVFSGVSSQFNISSWNGYSGHFAGSTVEQIRAHPAVARVERNYYVHAQRNITTYDGPWNLGVLSGNDFELEASISWNKSSSRYEFDGDSLTRQRDMWAYVIDSGIRTTHKEFDGGRAHAGWTAYPDRPNEDDFGHGTHVAGIIAGRNTGVCKKCNVVGVKALDEKGKGTTEAILQAIHWTVENITSEGRTERSVLNLSFALNCDGNQVATCGKSLNDAVRGAYESGVVCVVAAGNFHHVADRITPASTPEAITVAAVGERGQLSRFSAFGSYVDIAAPGEHIWGPDHGSDGQYTSGSGTSQAAPHVSGLILYLKSAFPNASRMAEDAVEKLLELARPGLLSMSQEESDAGTPNLLAYNGILNSVS